MQAFHRMSAVFDDPNLIGSAGLVPVMRLAERAGLNELLRERLSVPSAHAGGKAACVVAGMLAGADSIDDLDVLRHGGMAKVFTGVRAPSTLGTFLRSFRFGHVRQLDAVASRVVAGLAGVSPRLLAGATDPQGLAFVDIDDTIREVHGYQKQGVAYGYSGVKGLNAQLAVLSSPTCAPVIAASRLRRGNAVSGHGAQRLILDAVATARGAGVTGQVMVRADSGYYRQDVVAAAVAAKAWFSVTVRMNPAVTTAIAGIPDNAWTTIRYPNAIWDDEQHRWVSEAEVAETTFVAFSSHPIKRQVPSVSWCAGSSGSTPPRRRARTSRTSCSRCGATTGSSPTPPSPRSPRTGGPPACGGDPPRPRHRRTGHRRAEERTLGPRPVGNVHRQRRLADPGLHRVQRPARGRSGRLRPARQSEVGHPAHPPHHDPGPDRLHSPRTRAAPADRLALGPRLGRPLDHRHTLTTRPEEPRRTTPTWKSRTDRPPIPHASTAPTHQSASGIKRRNLEE